jgi:hypothetical protein
MANNSKVLGVRLPLDFYLEILKEAQDAKMTITDYAIQVLYKRKETTVKQDNSAELRILLNIEREKVEKEWQNRKKIWENGITELTEEVENYKKRLHGCQRENDRRNNELVAVTKERDTLRALLRKNS